MERKNAITIVCDADSGCGNHTQTINFIILNQ